MKHTNTYSLFLMDNAFEDIISYTTLNERVDYEWDIENKKEIDHKNKTIKWLEDSLDLSKDKSKWYRRFLSKVKKVNPKVKKKLLIMFIPIVIGTIGINLTTEITEEELSSTESEFSIIEDIIEEHPKENEIESYKTVDIPEKSFDEFIKDVAFRESSGRWDISNRYGYMGLFQIGTLALKDISDRTNDPELKNLHKKINKQRFDDNPNIFPVELQKKAFKQLIKNNQHYLRRYYNYVGKTVGGVKVTESGMLGAAHLVGQSGIKKYLSSNGKIDPTDGNGVKCSSYLKLFSDYNINL